MTVGNNSKNAYAFLVAGCNPSQPGAYVGYLYNILAASFMLADSKYDIIVMIRMSVKTREERLPAQHEKWLQSAGVKMKYLPKNVDEKSDTFFTAILDKFAVLDMVEYDSVLFLDTDVLPLCNLDYVFDLVGAGDGALWDDGNSTRRNLILAWKTEPSNAGFFIVRPGKGELDELNEIIRRQRESHHAKTQWPPFSEEEGWGHSVSWRNIRRNRGGDKWDFYGAYADQGLLYMWTKYHKKDVTNVFGNVVEHWADVDEDGEVEMISTSTLDYIDDKSCSNSSGDILKRGGLYTHAPYRDFHHFTGKSKPWLSKGTGHLLQSLENATSAQDAFYWALQQEVTSLNLGGEIDMENLHTNLTQPPLGLYPAHILMKWAWDAANNETGAAMGSTS